MAGFRAPMGPRVLATAAMLLATTGLPAIAHAQAQAAAVPNNEVVIVATPLDAAGVALSQVPTNAQTVSQRQVQAQNPLDLANLLDRNIGSVSVSDGTGNPYQNDVNYRGFQATSLLGAPVGLAVYFDGVRVNEPFGAIVNWDLIPTNAISHVDIEPGSNPIFGLNALGGALVVNTRNGQDSPGVTASVLGGSFGRWAGTIEAGGSDAATHTDFFIAGNSDKQNGFRDFSASSVQQVYAKARWHGPEDHTLVELSAAYANTFMGGTQALPMDMLSNIKSAYTAPDSIANKLWMFNLKATQWLNDQNTVSGEVYVRQSNSSSQNSNADLDDGCFNDDGSIAFSGGVAKCGNQAPNGTAINSVTGANALALGFGRWTSDINASLVESSTTQRTVGVSGQWHNGADLFGRKNSFILGGAFDQSNIAFVQNTIEARMIDYQTIITPNKEYGFTANGLPPSPTNLPAFTGSNVLDGVVLGSRVNELNVYGTDTFNVTDQLSITASLGYEYTSINQSGVNSQYLNDDGGYSWTDDVTGLAYYNPGYVTAYKYSNTGTGAVATPNGIPAHSLAGPETNSLNGVHSYSKINPAIGFNYNLNPAINFFGDYSESMRAPTSVELSCANPDSPCALPTGFNGDPDLKAVTSRSVELGARGQFAALGARFSWNAAIYDSRLQNDIQFIATSTTYGYFQNVGDTERRGAELGGAVQWNRLNVSANYGYVDALYRSSFTTSAGEAVTDGDFIPGIPRHTFKLEADYQVTDALRLGGGVVATGPQYAHGNENNQDPTGVVPGYAVVDLDAEYRIIKALRVSVHVENLLDQRYATYGLSGTNSIYSLALEQFRTPAPPRAVWLKFTYAFGGAEDR